MTGSISAGLSKINKYNKMPDHIKILNKIFSCKGELSSFLLQHAFIQWKSVCHNDYILVILADEFGKLHLTANILYCYLLYYNGWMFKYYKL